MPSLLELMYGPVTANQSMLTQGLRGREANPRAPVQGPATLAELLQNVGMVPGLGGIGLAGDLRQYATQPETRGALPYAMSALGVLPGVRPVKKLLSRLDDLVEPPVAEGMVRMYRGGGSRGGYYTPDREVADFFFGQSRQLRYVDVPPSVADAAYERAIKTGQTIPHESAAVLPQEYRKASKVIAERDQTGKVFQVE